MKLIELKSKIEELGYKCYLDNKTLIGGISDGWSEELNIELLKSTFSIKRKNNIFIVDFTIAHLQKEKEFVNDAEVIEFIKQEFPID